MEIGVVGSGSIGRRHVSNLLSLGYVNLALISEKSKISEYCAKKANIVFHHSYDEFLATPAECVVICNPTSMHQEYLERAVLSKKHVLLEKPASTSSAGLREIAAQARAQERTVAMVHQFRFDHGIEVLRDYIESGKIGEVIQVSAVQGEHIADFHPGEDYKKSYAARHELGGGVLLTQIHQLDLLNWLFGPFSSVSAVGGNSGHLGINVEDTVSYLLKNDQGLPVYGHVDYLLRPKTMKIFVTGTNGTIEWSYYDSYLKFESSEGHRKNHIINSPLDRDGMFRKLLIDFFDAVNEGHAPRSSLIEGLRSIEIVEAIKLSLASEQTQRITSCVI